MIHIIAEFPVNKNVFFWGKESFFVSIMVGPRFFDGVIGDIGKTEKHHARAYYGSKHWCCVIPVVMSSVHRAIQDKKCSSWLGNNKLKLLK